MARCLALDTQSRASYSHALDSHGDTVRMFKQSVFEGENVKRWQIKCVNWRDKETVSFFYL